MPGVVQTALRAVGYAATFLAGAALFVPDPTGALLALALLGAGLAGTVAPGDSSTTTVAQLVTTLGGAAALLALYAALVADLPARLRGGASGS